MKPSAESAGAITQFFSSQGYTEEALSRLGLAELPWSALATLSVSGWSFVGEPVLELLIRVFYLGDAVALDTAEKFIPLNVLQALLELRLLQRQGEWLQGACTLTRLGELLLAFDSRQRFLARAEDLVLGVNPTTRLLINCSMIHPGGRVLDLGTGCGTLAIAAASKAGTVIGTDVNRRALEFGRINAALNGVNNLDFVLGDRFEPVTGQRFDSIVCNPPFFLAPTSGLLYSENNIELDGFVESLARSAPAYLEEGGVFQMLCEWAERDSEPWNARLRSWFENCQCDVHIWWGYTFGTAEYARKRAVEQGQLDRESAGSTFMRRISYLNERSVKAIWGGLITLRRRSGENWFWVEEMQKQPDGPIGEALRERFSTRDILESKHEEELLRARPRLAPQVHLVSESVQCDGAWSAERSYLERKGDLPARLVLDALLSELVAHFDGSDTLEGLLKQVAKEHNVPMDQVIPEGIRVTKVLATTGLVLLDRKETFSLVPPGLLR
jgi:methylase of polypeptide subunit release factors